MNFTSLKTLSTQSFMKQNYLQKLKYPMEKKSKGVTAQCVLIVERTVVGYNEDRLRVA